MDWMKFCMSTVVGTWTNWSTFEPDPDHSPDAGTGISESRRCVAVGQTGTSLRAATGHGMHCREILFAPRCSQRAREFPRSVNVSLRRTGAELRGVKVAQFSDFGLFSPYKTPKTYLSVTSLQPRGYIAEWLRFFHVVVKSKKGCLPAVEFSCDIWYGSWEWDPQTCPNFRLWQMAIPIQNFTARCVRSGPKMSENA